MLRAGWIVHACGLLRPDSQGIQAYALAYLLVGQSVTPDNFMIAAFIQKLSCGDA